MVELKAELTNHGLAVSGRKVDLVARLTEDVESTSKTESGDDDDGAEEEERDEEQD